MIRLTGSGNTFIKVGVARIFVLFGKLRLFLDVDDDQFVFRPQLLFTNPAQVCDGLGRSVQYAR